VHASHLVWSGETKTKTNKHKPNNAPKTKHPPKNKTFFPTTTVDSDDLAAFQELEADLAALAEESDSDDDEEALDTKRRLRSLGSASMDGWVGLCVVYFLCFFCVCVCMCVYVLGMGVWGGSFGLVWLMDGWVVFVCLVWFGWVKGAGAAVSGRGGVGCALV
jgi:hypothetical protein